MFSTTAEKTYAGHFKTKGVLSSLDGKLGLGLLNIGHSGTPAFIKIKTSIPAVSPNADFTVSIKGFVYQTKETADITVCWHWYNNTFWNATATSLGSWSPSSVTLSSENGLVCIILTSPSYWPKLYVESAYSAFYEDNYWHDWDWAVEDAAGSPTVVVPLTTRGIEMMQTTLTSAAKNNIVANDGGEALLALVHSSNEDVLTVESNRIKVKKKGFVFVSANQDIIATSTGSYVALTTIRSGITQHEQLAAGQGVGNWTAIHTASAFPVGANQEIYFNYTTGETISSIDYNTWSAYNVIWSPTV